MIVYTRHARRRILEKGLPVETIERVATAPSAFVESYPEDMPFPSRLVLGWDAEGPMHVVVAEDADSATLYIVTAYRPDATEWENGFTRRKGLRQ